MWLVLCHTTDVAALWAYQGLKARELAPLELISAESLTYSLCWAHRIGAAGTDVEITLADGRAIRSDHVRGVLNRLLFVPLEHWRSATQGDRDYVQQELTAFYASWLYSLPCPVINRPTALSLAGSWRHPSEWNWLAARAGLPTSVYRQSSLNLATETPGDSGSSPAGTRRETVFTLADRFIGPAATAELREGCLHLAELSGTTLLGIEFNVDTHGEWLFVNATPTPNLILGGSALLNEIQLALERPR